MPGGHYVGGGNGGPPPGFYGGAISGPPPGYEPPPAAITKEVNTVGGSGRKTYFGLHLPALMAGLFVVVAILGGSVYLFAFGGLDQVTDFFAPPSASPTVAPTISGGTTAPTVTGATNSPTNQPVTDSPTSEPTNQPITESPTNQPTREPTNNPTSPPTTNPTTTTGSPTQPTAEPTAQPTNLPTRQPTAQPTNLPTRQPTAPPSFQPTPQPTAPPTNQPTPQPTAPPTEQPTSQPTTPEPTSDPTNNPTRQPTSDPTNNPTPQPSTATPTGGGGTVSPTPLPTNLRAPSSPYIVVTFTSPPTTPSGAVTAFNNAAARWSTILAGTNIVTASAPAGSTFNQFSCGLTNDANLPTTVINQLHIAADIAPIDGVGSILGQAGPCPVFLESLDRPGVELPVLGAMTFDSADIGSLETAGTLEDVILHEMGHVLGLGTLWSGIPSLGLPQLLINPIFPSGGSPVPGNTPLYVGHGARSEYVTLSGSNADVPVEDGSFQGLTPAEISAGQGQGSIDGHWMENLFVNELMTPAIGGTGNPLSIMSLRSLEDIGYAVDTSQADAYSIPGPSSGNGVARTQSEPKTILHGDMFISPDLEKGRQLARDRARARRRLGGPNTVELAWLKP